MSINTAIPGFAEFLGGGVPPIVLVLIGSPGSGSEVFAKQIALSRAKENSISYITVMKKPEYVRKMFSSYGWSLKSLEKKGKWRFITPSKNQSWINTIKEEMDQHRSIVIDSLSELLITRKIDEIIKILTTLSNKNQECQELHQLLLTEGMQDPKTENTIQHFAEGVIYFSTTWETEIASQSLIIKKMKGVFAPLRKLPYSIGKKGLKIETTTRIT
jgi:KaiC/GvpD/RAD55 family RecA-like ATPase